MKGIGCFDRIYWVGLSIKARINNRHKSNRLNWSEVALSNKKAICVYVRGTNLHSRAAGLAKFSPMPLAHPLVYDQHS